MVEYLEWASSVGYPGRDGRWTDLSPEALERRRQTPHWVLQALQSVDRSVLTPRKQVFKKDALPLNLLDANIRAWAASRR